MKLKDFFKKIRESIARDEVQHSIALMNDLIKESPNLNETILQSARLSRLTKQIRTGEISFSEANIEKNSIIAGLLDLIEEIEQNAKSNDNIKNEIKDFNKQNLNINYKVKHEGKGNIHIGNNNSTTINNYK